MAKYRVKWHEIRLHYIDLEAKDDFDAIEEAKDFPYEQTASDESRYDDYEAKILTDDDE